MAIDLLKIDREMRGNWVVLAYVEEGSPDHGFQAAPLQDNYRTGMPYSIRCNRRICACELNNHGKECHTEQCPNWLFLNLVPATHPSDRGWFR